MAVDWPALWQCYAQKARMRRVVTLTLLLVDCCFYKTHMNLYGVLILGVSIKYRLCYTSFLP